MIDAESIGLLVDALDGDDDPAGQRLLLRALLALDLSAAAWTRAAPVVAPLAQRLAAAPDLDAGTAALLARLPLASVRRRLRSRAADATAANALPLAVALAGVRDGAGLATLLAACSPVPDDGSARALAALPLEDLQPALLQPLLMDTLDPARDDDPVARLWCAVALARCGEFEPLEQLWDALVRPPDYWIGRSRPVLWRRPPPLFDGDPEVALAQLVAVRPLPARVVQFLLGLRANDYDERWQPRNPLVGDARNAILLVAGLTGSCDRYGEPVAAVAPPAAAPVDPLRALQAAQRLARRPWDGLQPAIDAADAPLLAQAPAEVAAEALESGVVQLAAQAPQYADAPGYLLGNALLGLATALPARLPLRLTGLLLQPALERLPRQPLAWTLARGGAERALQALLPLIVGSSGAPRRQWLEWLVDIAAQVDAPAPFGGAGGALPPPPAPPELIDDAGAAHAHAAMREAASIRHPQGPDLAPDLAPDPFETRAAEFNPGRPLSWDEPAMAGAAPDGDAGGGDFGELLGAPLSAGVRSEPDAAAAPDALSPPSAPRELARAPAAQPAAAAAPVAPAPAADARPPRTVYPDIGVDDEHPLAGATVNFSVALVAARSAVTGGVVNLPGTAPDEALELRVRLLLGSASAWSKLRWSAAQGTIEPARFALPAPAVDGERALATARADFYFEQRWCGEGRRHLDLRAGAAVAPLAEIPRPEESPPWTRALRIEPGAQPPDLIVRIQKGTAKGEYLWSCLSPHREFAPALPGDDRMTLGEDAETFVRKTFAPLANKPLARLKLADVEGAGEKLYRSTPPHFRDCYWALFHAAAREGWAFEAVQIVTDEPCVPWELMRLADAERAPGVAPELLAIRHAVGRWLADRSTQLRQRIAVQRVAVSASSYDGIAAVSAKLPWAASERELLATTYAAQQVPLTSDAQLDFLEHGGAQAVHVACHGKMSIADPDASVLVMEDTPNDLTPLTIARNEVCAGLGREHPLVFLNACEVGASAASMSLVAGFPAAFLYAGAAALVSPLWAVNDERARAIAELFYREAFANGRPLGEVLREVRRQWKEQKHLTYLAYVLYGDPLARIDYRHG